MANNSIFKYACLIVFVINTTPFFSQENENLIEGFNEIQLTNSIGDNRYASYNKEGTKIVFESNRDGHWQVYTMDIDGTNQKRLINSTSNDKSPRWHPYKNIIIFESDRTGISEIYTYNLDSNSTKKISISLKKNKSYPHFAPNGVEIVFSYQETEKMSSIYMCSTKGKRLDKVISNNHINLYPNFTPRGDSIVYFSTKNTQGETQVIYSFNITTHETERLSYFKDDSVHPNWSNIRGSHIVYSAKEDNATHSEIYTMRHDGTYKTRITFNETDDILPSWSPNDINLLISSFRNGNFQICKILLKEPLNTTK